MRPTIEQLIAFYRTPLGSVAANLIGRRISDVWRPFAHMTSVGLGYPVPYLPHMPNRADCANSRTIALMPWRQGGCTWPEGASCATALIETAHLPLADQSLDRLLMVHALEHAHQPARLLRECWRVLKPGGELLIIVPNRRRSWSALETTPFGTGQPWSVDQLGMALEDHMFDVPWWQTALMMPPLQVRGIATLMRATETLITENTKLLGGVLAMLGRKETQGFIGGSGGKAVRATVRPQPSSAVPSKRQTRQ